MNKKAMIISIALSTFVLIAVGGIAYSVRAADKAQAVANAVPQAGSSDPSIDPTMEQAINEREAAYQQMIAEANARLEQAQQEQQALQAQLANLQAKDPAVAGLSTLTPEQAVAIASDFLGQTSVYTVEMTAMRGESLYKVTFSSGDIVYIGLDGQVAGSAPAPQVVVTGSRAPHQGEGEEHEDDHDD